MAIANDIRKGNAIRYNGDICLVLDQDRVKPGKGGAFVQTTLRNLRTGKSNQVRFNSSETVEIIVLRRVKLEYSYRVGSDYVFIDPDTFEQVTVGDDLVGPARDYLVEEGEYELVFDDQGSPIMFELPPSVVLTVAEAPEGLKGDSATNVRKPVTLETGLEINVPLFIKEGEKIKIDTRTGEYQGRA
ncbi:MAG: elongation factor P [Methanosaeta sp. SDB]|nr:MAG: elongation factor P [Methanosaeta sp. SDB]